MYPPLYTQGADGKRHYVRLRFLLGCFGYGFLGLLALWLLGLLIWQGGKLLDSVRSHQDSARIYVRVQGAFGTEFGGSIMEVKGGNVTSHSVSGSVPYVFASTADSVSVAFQKKSAGTGVLEVVIDRGETKVLNRASTVAEFGMVSATGN